MLGLNAGTAYVPVKPDLRGFHTSIGAQLRTTDRTFASAGSTAGQSYQRSFGRRFLGGLGTVAKRGALTIGTIGVLGAAAFAKNAISLEQEFGKTMNQIQAATNTPAKGMKQLSDLAMKMGRDTTFSASDASKAMLELAHGGMNAATIQGGALKGTLTLAAAGELDMSEAANVAVKSMGQFNLHGKDMKGIAAALAGAANASSASVNDMSMALAQGGLAANSVGFSIQETTGILAAFSNKGLEGADAGTSMKTALDRLVPTTKTASDAMKNVGLMTEAGRNKFLKANGEFKSAAQISQVLKNATDDLSSSERKRTISAIFGSDAQRAATILSEEGAKGIRKMIKATSDQDAAQRMAQANMKGTAGAIESMKGSLETAALSMGIALRPATIGIAHLVRDIANRAIPYIQKFGVWLRGALKGDNVFKDVWGWIRRLLPQFREASKVAPSLVKGLTETDRKTQHSVFERISEQLRNMGPDAKKAFAGIGPALLDAVHELPSFTDMLNVTGVVLGFLADHAGLVAKALPYLAAGFLVVKTAQLASNAAAAVAVPVRIAEVLAVRAQTNAMRALTPALSAQTAALAGSTTAEATLTGAKTAGTGATIRSRLATMAKVVWDKVSAGAAKALAGAQWLLNAAMSANPIGILVAALIGLGAIFVLLWRKNDAFRTGVIKLWNAIKGAVVTAVKFVIGFVKKHWALILPIVLGPLGLLIVAVVKNWGRIVAAVKFAWERGIKPALRAIGSWITGTLIPLFKRLWANVVRPVFAAIGRGIAAAWEHVIKPVFRGLSWFLEHVVFPVFRALWNGVVKPIFRLIGAAIRVWWAGVRIVFALLKAYFERVLFPVFRFLWTRIVKPIFGWIGDRISSVWNKTIKPVFSALGSFIRERVVPAFRKGVDAIAAAWEGIKKAAAAPVNFVIETVYNNGIRKFVNGLLDKFDIGSKGARLPFVQPLGAKMHGGQQRRLGGTLNEFKAGGIMPGYTPGRDVHHFVSPTGGRMSVSGGEAWMVPEFTKAVGPRRIMAWNAAVRRGGAPALQQEMGFANGGILGSLGGRVQMDGEPLSKIHAAQIALAERLSGMAMRVMQGSWQAPSSYSGTSHTGSGVADTSPGSFHAQRWLRKVGIAAWARNIPGAHSAGSGAHVHGVSRLDPAARGNSQLAAFAAGGDGLGGSDYGPNPPTLPNLFSMLAQFKNLSLSQGASGGFMSKIVSKVVGWVADKGKSLLGKVPGSGSTFGKIAVGVGQRVVDSVADWITAKFGGGAGGGFAGKAVGSAQTFAKGLLSNYRWGPGQFGPLKALWNKESGWRWNAKNPSSGAYGIPQALPGSKMASAGKDWLTNAATQIRWGLGYIKGRYGSPAAAWAHSQAHNWYRRGGIIPKLFDNGGILPKGLSLAMNRTGRNEHKAVFTDKQWRVLKQAITGLTLNHGGAIGPSWLTDVLGRLPKSAEQLRREFTRARDAMRGFRTHTELARRTLKRIRESDRFQARAEEARQAERAFKATRSGEEIGADVSDTRGDIRRALRRARRSPIGRDALRDYHQAARKLEKQRTADVVAEATKRAKWRRGEARDALRNANAPVIAARAVLKKAQDEAEKAKGKEDKRAARQAVRAAHQSLHAIRQRPDSETQKRARHEVEISNRRLKALRKESNEIDRLTKQRDHAGQQSEAVKQLVASRKRLDALREERKERVKLRREARRAGNADILKREEKAQERLTKRIAAEKKARAEATAAAKAYRAAQDAARERATGIRDAGLELGGIGSASFKTSGGILSNLTRAVTTVKDWGSVVRALIGAGLRGPILDEFINDGPSADAVRTGKSLLAGGQIGKINRLQDQLRAASIRAGSIGARSYTPAQRAAIRRATPVRYQAAQSTAADGGVHVHVHGMPSDTANMVADRAATRVMYQLDKERV